MKFIITLALSFFAFSAQAQSAPKYDVNDPDFMCFMAANNISGKFIKLTTEKKVTNYLVLDKGYTVFIEAMENSILKGGKIPPADVIEISKTFRFMRYEVLNNMSLWAKLPEQTTFEHLNNYCHRHWNTF